MMADAAGMRGNRSRNQDGTLRRTRKDKLVKTIEKENDVDFRVRGDMLKGTLLKRLGVDSEDKAVHLARSGKLPW
jgi:hypothetical protein